jgi:hypothetical protein
MQVFGNDVYCMDRSMWVDNRELNFIDDTIDLDNMNVRVERIERDDFFLFHVKYDNIGHFFHDHFFIFYCYWRLNKGKVLVQIHNTFYYDFIKATLGDEYIELQRSDTIYVFNNLNIIGEFHRDLKVVDNFIGICNEIKYNCFNYYGITENRTRSVIYGRNDLNRKRLLEINYEFMSNNNIEIINNMSTYTFYETLILLSQVKSLIYMFGAGITYLIFLSKDTNVLEIHPNENDSWAMKFGLNELCKHNIIISNNTKQSNYKNGQNNKALDDDVYYDTALQNCIKQIIDIKR